MEKLQEDIKMGIEFVNKPFKENPHFSAYSTPFLFTTESQEGVSKAIEYKDKKVFTVASSGDQYLGAMYYGADIACLYDINRLSYYMSYLKIAAIKTLLYEEFIKFFIPIIDGKLTNDFWNYRVFKKLLYELPSDVALFWERIIYEINIKKTTGNLVSLNSHVNELDNVKSGMPFYSSESEYYVLQNILRNKEYPKFNEVSILELDSIVDTYDVIYLSNIIECLVMEELMPYSMYGYMYMSEDRVENDKLMKLGPSLFRLLNDDGVIMVDYRANKSKGYSNDLLFNNDYFDVTEIKSKYYVDEGDYGYSFNTDLVLTYKPSKTGYYMDR